MSKSIVGIYALYFKNIDKIYVGQSIDIEKRYTEHLNNIKSGKANYKVLHAYNGEDLPELFILEKCSREILNNREVYWIKELDTVNTGLNILEGGSHPSTSINAPGSKYTKEQLIDVLKLLYDGKSHRFIAKATGVKEPTIVLIVNGSRHTWLKKELPKEYLFIRNKYLNRLLYGKHNEVTIYGMYKYLEDKRYVYTYKD